MSTKRRPNSRRPGAPTQARQTTRQTTRQSTRRTTRETSRPAQRLADRASLVGQVAEVEQVDDGEQPPVGALYPQILRTPGRNTLRTVGGMVIGIALFFLAATLIGQVVVLISWRIAGHGSAYAAYYAAANRFERPSGMLAANLGLAAAIPLSMGLVGFLHRVRPQWLASVRPRMRWRYLLLALVIGLIALGGVQAISMVVTPVRFHPQPGFWGFLVVIVLTSPLQAAGEEYFFRGYLLQSLGSLVANPWFGIVVSSVIFALAHFSLNPALFADRLVFGLLAALLVRLTGGLEAGIAAHVVNNLLAFILAGLTSTIASVRTITSLGWANAGLDVGAFALFALLAWLASKALKLQTRVGEPGRRRANRPVRDPGGSSGLGETVGLQ